MNLSAPFVSRPIGTWLLTIGLALAGIAAYFALPVSPLPQVDFPTISVQVSLPGASPETMASSVATPLERRLGIISDVTEMTSQSSTGSARITLQFDLNRDIDGAARDVMAAINASRVDLPATLKSNPTYRKVNPADAPIMIVALTSKTMSPGQIYDAASNVVQQRLAQVDGVGDVEIGGSSLPAVRVELLPQALSKYGIALEDVRNAISAANANRPKGGVQTLSGERFQIYTNDTGQTAADFKGLVVAWRNGRPVRLSDIASVLDSVEDVHTLGLFNGQPAVVAIVSRQPGANIIQTVDGVKAILPELKADMPGDIDVTVASDRTITIRASLAEVETTLGIALILVIIVVSVFLKSIRATIVPAVAVAVSILGALGVMYMLGFSLNNLSLMALTVATGFVVDDAIVVLENISRHLEEGMPRFEAAMKGSQEVGFTVLSISISLVAVFIPLLFMGGIVGRLFREFAMTLSAAVLISLIISLTTTPMMCAYLLRPPAKDAKPSWFARHFDAGWDRLQGSYARALHWALDHGRIVLLLLVGVIVLNIYLFLVVQKGFFPTQDTGQLNGGLRADQSISFQAMHDKLQQFVDVIRKDPAVATVVGFTGGSRAGGGFMFVTLKTGDKRESSDLVVNRLRPQLAQITGASLFLNPVQDVRVGGRSGNATYQYTLKSDNTADLKLWAGKLAEAMGNQPSLIDIDSDQQDHGVETFVDVDRATASRFGLTSADIDNALYDAYGQRQVSTIYRELNQYHIIMEVDPKFSRDPSALRDLYVPATAAPTTTAVSDKNGGAGKPKTTTSAGSSGGSLGSGSSNTGSSGSNSASDSGTATGSASTGSSGGNGSETSNDATSASAPGTVGSSDVNAANASQADSKSGSSVPGAPISASTTNAARTMVPLFAFAKYGDRAAATEVNHQDTELATTISFNLAEGYSLSDAQTGIANAEASIGMPATVHGSFAGTAKTFQQSLASEPLLILAALLAIYIVLGMLYESYIHPITVLSTLPSAGVGAVIALMMVQLDFSIIALIGVILLIGIVKKNAILIIDVAIEAQRSHSLTAKEAIFQASMQRFRPILMTTFAAALGAVPLAIGFGEGAELRRPLGIAIVGGLIASQFLTLLTTPVIYVYMDRLRRRPRSIPSPAPQPGVA